MQETVRRQGPIRDNGNKRYVGLLTDSARELQCKPNTVGLDGPLPCYAADLLARNTGSTRVDLSLLPDNAVTHFVTHLKQVN